MAPRWQASGCSASTIITKHHHDHHHARHGFISTSIIAIFQGVLLILVVMVAISPFVVIHHQALLLSLSSTPTSTLSPSSSYNNSFYQLPPQKHQNRGAAAARKATTTTTTKTFTKDEINNGILLQQKDEQKNASVFTSRTTRSDVDGTERKRKNEEMNSNNSVFVWSIASMSSLQESDWGEIRNCSSPEFDAQHVTWPLGGCPNPVGTSYNHHRYDNNNNNDYNSHYALPPPRTCGLCGQSRFARHLQELAKQIQVQFQLQCQNRLVIYGAAFGKQTRIKGVFIPTAPCYFLLILDETLHQDETLLPSSSSSSSSSSNKSSSLRQVIVVRKADLPYKNNRRNIKMFKMNPHLLFPWAVSGILWVDAKMGRFINIQPHALLQYYETTVAQRNGVCGAVMGLPRYKGSVGQAAVEAKVERPTFVLHTNRILDDFVKRPTVSDSKFAIQNQVRTYLQQVSNITLTSFSPNSSSSLILPNGNLRPDVQSLPLDMALIDTALLAWNLKPDHCRSFVADLLCTWLSEIHCYSDRDQVSFSFAVHQMMMAMTAQSNNSTKIQPPLPLQVIDYNRRILFAPAPVTTGAMINETMLQQQKQQPLLHFVRTKCHWYYGRNNLYKCGPNEYKGF